MHTGFYMEPHLGRWVPCVLSLVLLTHLSQAAPGLPSEEHANARPLSEELANPFGSGDEERRLLQSFIQSSVKDSQGGPEINTWEQEVFFLFGLYDYDRSGLLDGLEMMKLLSDYNSHHAPGVQLNERVVSTVDFLLQTQDQNQDGLLAPSELLSPPLPHTQNSSNDAKHQEQEQEQEQEVAKDDTDVENAGAAEQTEEVHEEQQPQEEEQQEITTEEEPVQEADDQQKQQIPEAVEAEQEQEHKDVPVHQGQPEI